MRKVNQRRHVWWSCLLALALVVGMLPVMQEKPTKAATTTEDVTISVTYGQTEARKLCAAINGVRQSVNQQNEAAIASSSAVRLEDLAYDYKLEETAMQRAAEVALNYNAKTDEALSCLVSSASGVCSGWGSVPASLEYQKMVDSSYQSVGVGHVVYNGHDYWVALYSTSPASAASYVGPSDGAATRPVSSVQVSGYGLSVTLPSTLSLEVGGTYDLSSCKATIQADGHYPSGESCPIEGSVSVVSSNTTVVTYNGASLVAQGAGTANITITCAGKTHGTIKVTVTQPTLANATISTMADQTYTGYAICPTLTVYVNSTVLRAGTDYTVAYKNNVNIGTATVTITGIGSYTGTKTANFRITGPSLNAATIAAIPDQLYTGNEIKPSLTVTVNNITLTQNVDYTVSYRNNRNEGTATVTITGKGNYSGTKTTTFRILAKNISNATVSSIDTQRYTGSDICPSVTVQIASVVLVKNVDYTLTYRDNRSPGTASITITGTGTYTGTKTVTFKIAQQGLSSATVKVAGTLTYNGDERQPRVTVKLGSRILQEDEDYEVDYRNNVKPGKATVVIYGLGDYSGSKKAYFVIRPGKPSWVSARANGSAAVLTWKRDRNVNGYEVYRSRSASSGYSRLGSLNKNTSTKCQNVQLSQGTYYYKLRSYVEVNGRKYYSAYSKARKVMVR